MLSADQGSRVRVALRVRPGMIPNSIQQQPQTPGKDRPITRTSVQIVPDEPQVVIGREESSQKSFTFDHVYGPLSTQDEIYKELAAPLVEQFLQGFNATILAYGQTFSGKTFTMGSSNDKNTPAADCGIIPRAFFDIMNKLPEDGARCIVKVSFLEIYQEQIRDLLMPHSTNKEISVRENKGHIVVSGVHEEVVVTIDDLQRCLISGGIERTTGDTLMHLHSSRSHAIFTITLELVQDSEDPFRPPAVIRRSKLHLVDLAGSERLKRTGAEGVRLKESVKINSGLLALGNVISILGDDKSGEGPTDRQTHVPYRDSKLTRLLQDSLGGNSQTLMLACVSPLYDDTDETINTMKYAYRARKIQNKPIVNVIDQLAMEKTNMQHKIDQLEGKLKGLEENGVGPVPFDPDMIDFDNDQWMQFFIEQLKNRTKKGTSAVKALDDANREISELKQHINILQIRHQEIEQKLQQQEQQQQQQASLSSEENDAFWRAQIEEMQISHEAVTALFQQSLDTLLAFSIKVLRGENPSDITESPFVKQIIKQHFPEELKKLERSSSKESLATTTFPPINQARAPSTNSNARTLRRKRITTEDLREDESNSNANLKPLEMELRETRKYLSQMEGELNRTRIRLQQTEAISEKSSAEISRLMDLNDALRSGKPGLEQPEIVSIKVLADAAIQTAPFASSESSSSLVFDKDRTSEGIDEKEAASTSESLQSYPVYSAGNNSDPADMNVERLAEELSIATKAKVDLLKELSKVNKEAEKTRHHHQDQILKMERELESLQREMNKIIEDHHEKDAMKERAKDDYERKIKHQESSIQKLKQKQKELEKTLKDKGSGDRRLQECQQEVDKLTIQIAGLKKKIKEDHEKFQDMETRKSKEIAVLNKQLEDEAKKGRQLELKSEMMRKKLDRKSEEIATFGKKTRDASISSNSTHRGRASLGAQLSTENLFEHSDLGGGEQQSSFSFHDADLSVLQSELKSARERMQSLEIEIETSSNQGSKYDALQKCKSETVLQIAKLRNEIRKREHESQLSKEFAAELEKISVTFSSNEAVQKIIEQMAVGTDISKFRASLLECFKELSVMQTQILDFEKDLHAKPSDSQEQVIILEKRLQKVMRAYDKKLAEMQKELTDAKADAASASLSAAAHAEVQNRPTSVSSEVQTDKIEPTTSLPPVPSIPAPASAPVDLEKDVFYYRNINKELKSKLREVVAVNHRLAKTLKKQAEEASSNSGDHTGSIDPSFPVAV